MEQTLSVRALTRRDLLASGIKLGAGFVVGAGFLAHAREAWALEMKALEPATMAALVLIARDIYPHDRIPDRFYAQAMRGYDDAAAEDRATLERIESGVADLDERARSAHGTPYAAVGWEQDRVALLRQIEGSEFFQTLRGGLVTGLYNQKEIWPYFGYEGASYEHGGYLHRGFDDIAWI